MDDTFRVFAGELQVIWEGRNPGGFRMLRQDGPRSAHSLPAALGRSSRRRANEPPPRHRGYRRYHRTEAGGAIAEGKRAAFPFNF